MPTTTKRTKSTRGTVRASTVMCEPKTTKRVKSAQERNSFQRIITPEEMREEMEMKKILRTKKSNRAFLRRIGVVFKKNGQIEVRPI